MTDLAAQIFAALDRAEETARSVTGRYEDAMWDHHYAAPTSDDAEGKG